MNGPLFLCFQFCMASEDNGNQTYKMMMSSFSTISPFTASFTLFFFFFLLLVVMAEDVQQELITTVPEASDDSAPLKKQLVVTPPSISTSSHQVPIPKTNGIQYSPLLGRKGGKQNGSVSWRDRVVFNASAHEVPSGPNPISNR